jgi:hypothetical protein
MNQKARILKRRHLIYYLEIYDEDTGLPLGHLVDVTTRGIKLVSKTPIEANKTFHMRMMLPAGYFQETVLHIEAISKWSNNDVNPDFFDTGFEVKPLDIRARQIIMKLVNLVGFND